MLPSHFVERLQSAIGAEFVLTAPDAVEPYGADALKRPHTPDVVVRPGSTADVAAVVAVCAERRVPMIPRGAGTGYTGGSVPLLGGVVISLERMNRILEIDERNLLAVVQPNVITGELQAAVERLGLFYPPDPASLAESVIGGNVAECAGGPRAFKYGTTRRYVLALEAVLPTGEIIRTGSRAVKNVVGYDLTQLLIGSEGTLAIITEITLRLIPKPPVQSTLRATFATVDDAVAAVDELLMRRVVPATVELVDAECLEAVARYLGKPLAPRGTGGLVIVEVDGTRASVAEDAARAEEACVAAGATEVLRATTPETREELWRARREISPSLKMISPTKFNHDVVVPRGRVPELFELIENIRTNLRLRMASFGHAGDGNIHVNIMVDATDADEVARAHRAEQLLFDGVVSMGGSISGEHGIGYTKAPFLAIELSPEVIALMKRVKQAFDPNGILNPGKIFPPV